MRATRNATGPPQCSKRRPAATANAAGPEDMGGPQRRGHPHPRCLSRAVLFVITEDQLNGFLQPSCVRAADVDADAGGDGDADVAGGGIFFRL